MQIALRQTGVTLIELMVAIGIIGILAAISIPAYQSYIHRANRADAKAILLENAQFLERNYTVANRYDQDASGNAVSLPVTVSPKTGTTLYNISASFADSTSYLITASPVSGSKMDGDECGSLSINQIGQKTVASATLSADTCWQK